MKITKRQLRRIIKEEKAKLFNEGSGSEGAYQELRMQVGDAYYALSDIMEEWEPRLAALGPDGEALKQKIYGVMDDILNKDGMF